MAKNITEVFADWADQFLDELRQAFSADPVGRRFETDRLHAIDAAQQAIRDKFGKSDLPVWEIDSAIAECAVDILIAKGWRPGSD